MKTRAVLLALLLALLVPAAAIADSVPIADDSALPWASGSEASPLEALAGRIASAVSGRTVTVRCEGDYDWGLLAAQQGFEPSAELGYVPFWVRMSGGVQVGAPYADTFAELSPTVCRALNTFALAATKPTKCAATRAVPQQRTTLVSRKVGKVRRVTRIKRTVYMQVTDAPAPCYLGNARTRSPQPASYWSDYFSYGLAMLALAHESIHLGGDPDEANANCRGLHWVRYVAQQLGASDEDAAGIAAYAVEKIYPQYRTVPGYWSPDCEAG